MIETRIVSRTAFEVIGKSTWISGQDNAQFARFWAACGEDGTMGQLAQITGMRAGLQTGGSVMGVSCVEKDPSNRAFYFMVGVEKPADCDDLLETHAVPACDWAVFSGRGEMPGALIEAEMYAFGEWLPSSGYEHALAPEIKVYLPDEVVAETGVICEFWLPIRPAG